MIWWCTGVACSLFNTGNVDSGSLSFLCSCTVYWYAYNNPHYKAKVRYPVMWLMDFLVVCVTPVCYFHFWIHFRIVVTDVFRCGDIYCIAPFLSSSICTLIRWDYSWSVGAVLALCSSSLLVGLSRKWTGVAWMCSLTNEARQVAVLPDTDVMSWIWYL